MQCTCLTTWWEYNARKQDRNASKPDSKIGQLVNEVFCNNNTINLDAAIQFS